MRLVGAVSLVVTVSAVPALAAELPSRKAGLWEVKTSIGSLGGIALTSQVCIDAATDQMLMSSAGPLAQTACAKQEVQKSGETITIDSTCTLGGKSAASHVIITGSFDSAVTVTATTRSDALPGGALTMTMATRWLGPCAADQKPGDMIMGNGVKMNILELRKRAPSQGVPLPP